MLLTIKESAALYAMDMVLIKLLRTLEETHSAVENMEAWVTPFFGDDDAEFSNKRSNEDIMTLLRY
jgi:hypothetical protein